MNSANRRKVHRTNSQSLGKSSEKIRLCDEKTPDTDDDEVRRRRKLEKQADFEKSRRARNEQANSEKRGAIFGDASKADGACVNTPGRLFFRISYPEQRYPVLAWNMLPNYPWSVSLNSQILPARVLWQFCKSPGYRNCTWSKGLCGSEKSAAGDPCFSQLLWTISGQPWLSTSRASLRMCGYAHSGTAYAKMAAAGALWNIWGEADSLG